MKKVFAMLVLAGSLAACNNDSDKTTDAAKMAADSAAAKMKEDSMANAEKMKMADTTIHKMDSAANKMNAAANKMDSAANKMKATDKK